MTGVPTLNTKIYIGLEPGSTWGTAPASTAWSLHPCNTFNGQNPYDVLQDTGYRGFASRVYREYQGVGHSEISFESNFYPEESGYLAKLIMGQDAITGTGPFVHKFSLSSTPESLTIVEAGFGTPTDANFARQFTGCRMTDMSLRFTGSQGLLTTSATFQGKTYSELAQSAMPIGANAADQTTTALEAWRATATVNGTADANIVEAEIGFKRDILVRWGLNNSQDPTNIYVGPLDVTFRATIDVTTTNHLTWRNYYKTMTQVPLVFTLTNPTLSKTVAVTMSNAVLSDSFEVDRSSPVNLMYHVSGHALHNTTDIGPATISVTNAKTTYAT